MQRSEYVATREDSLLLIVDIQQRMLKAIESWEVVAGKVKQLIRTSNALNVPILLTEQYRKGLGETLPDLMQEIDTPQVFPMITKFSWIDTIPSALWLPSH